MAVTAATLTAVPDGAFSPPRVAVTLNVTAAAQADVDALNLTVMRLGAPVPVPVREADPVPFTQVDSTHWRWTGHDYEAPHSASMSYEVWNNAAGAWWATAAPTTVLVLTPVPLQAWLIHPGLPSLSMPVDVNGEGTTTLASTQAVQQPLGRKRPVVVTASARLDDASSWVLNINNYVDLDALRAILSDETPLLMQMPAAGRSPTYCEYIAVGDVSWANKTGTRAMPYLAVSLPYVLVDRPVGPGRSARTWSDVLAEADTWNELLTLYETWADVLAGPTT